MDKKLERYFEKYGVKYVEHKHPATFRVEESRKLKKSIPGLHCKTLFLKDDKGLFYLIGMPAEKMLDSKKLRSLLKLKKVRFGTREELKEEVNLIPGSVSIFGIINAKKERVVLIIEKGVWEAEISGFHPNVNTSTLEMKHEDLEKFWNSLSCTKLVLEL